MGRNESRLIAWTLIVAGALLTARVARAEAPPASDVYIENAAYWGSGCRAGSVAHNISPDGQAFTLLFDSFIVEATPAQRLATLMCELDLKMHVPNGWSYAVSTVDVRGYAALTDPQSYGKVQTMAAFRRSREPKMLIAQKFRGPSTQDYQLSNVAELDALEWSPCGGSRVMRLRTRISAHLGPRSSSGSSLVTVDSLDGEVKQKYAITWKRCPGGRNDPADAAGAPDLGSGVTAECPVHLLNRQGQLVEILEGSGVGLTDASAKRAALADGQRLCRRARGGRMLFDCAPQNALCIVGI